MPLRCHPREPPVLNDIADFTDGVSREKSEWLETVASVGRANIDTSHVMRGPRANRRPEEKTRRIRPTYGEAEPRVLRGLTNRAAAIALRRIPLKNAQRLQLFVSKITAQRECVVTGRSVEVPIGQIAHR